jgi:uncharacterized protein YwgA
MKTYDFVHLSLLAVGGEIKGKTKLQKTVYFLGLMTGQLDRLGYNAHYYGPYSGEVAESVSTLEGVGFISSSVASVGSVDLQGFEVRRTDYHLTEEGRGIAEKKAAGLASLFNSLKKAAMLLKQAGDPDYVRLSIAAKTDFMLREKKAPATEGELEQLAKRFGWNVSQQQVREAAEYLRKLNLVEPVPT